MKNFILSLVIMVLSMVIVVGVLFIISKVTIKAVDHVVPRKIAMKVTAYCPCQKCCGKGAKGVTSTGKPAWNENGVAASLKLLPYGTELVIPGVGKRVVDDTGSVMRKDAAKGIWHIDVRMISHQKARRFGVKILDVMVSD